MTTLELREHLLLLQLTQAETAQLLGVTARTVRRWYEGEQVPGPADAALRAWRKLSERHLAWRPDSVTLRQEDPERIASYAEHPKELNEILSRVEARLGPRVFWTVNIPSGTATMGPMKISFYKLQNGGFSCSVYSRRDTDPDLKRDQSEIEDAIFCIAQEFKKADQRAKALQAVAKDVRSKSAVFGHSGPQSLSSTAREDRQKTINALADLVDALAARALSGEGTSYREFEAISKQLADNGYSPPNPLLTGVVARCYVDRTCKIRVLFVKSGRDEDSVTKTTEVAAAQISELTAGHRLKFLGSRLPSLGESSALHAFAGPDHVVLDVPRGVGVVGSGMPGLYLVEGLHPSNMPI